MNGEAPWLIDFSAAEANFQVRHDPSPSRANNLMNNENVLPPSELDTASQSSIQAQVEYTGMRSTSDFPRTTQGLSRAQLEHHYKAMRNSHASLMRSRGQLQRRSREFSEARLNFLNTLKTYEQRLVAIGEEKAEAMRIAQDMHQELEAFENKQQALDHLLHDLEEAKQGYTGFWSILQINQLIERMKLLLRGAS
ncbi:hypothetical protein [Synechococcus sp. UW140]|uniref:hypothetical protein n=1 Tax=Synechococcus sp. UW140 TaxID=368503 RepID=UPI0010BD3047|nr:hypothetical protein [Synechococcus sp. UW140]